MKPRKLIADQPTAVHALSMSTEKIGEPADRTDSGIRVTKQVGVLRKKTESAQLVVRDGHLHFEGDEKLFGRWAKQVIENLPTGILEDQGITEASGKFGKVQRKFLGSRLRDLPDVLRPTEHVYFLESVNVDKGACLLVITNERLMVRQLNALGMKQGEQEVNVDQITSVSSKTQGMLEKVTVTVSNWEIEMKDCSLGTGNEIQVVLGKIRVDKTAPAPVPSAPAPSGVEDLAKLAELHAAGVLTDEEFAAAKAKALGI